MIPMLLGHTFEDIDEYFRKLPAIKQAEPDK